MAKIGEGHVAAMGRLGLKELRNAFNPSRESVAGDELGVFGAATPGQIDRGLEVEPIELKMETISLDDLRATAMENQGHGLPAEATKQHEHER